MVMTTESDKPKWAFSTELSVEELKSILDYDPDTGFFVWKKSIGTRSNVGSHAGSVRNCYIYIQIYGSSYPAHVLAWFYIHGVWEMIDHKNHDRADNSINNLRVTNYQLNAANRQVTISNSTVKGVYKRGDKYEAGIKVNQRRIYLGVFNTLDGARQAYENAAKEHFGEYAYTNKAET